MCFLASWYVKEPVVTKVVLAPDWGLGQTRGRLWGKGKVGIRREKSAGVTVKATSIYE